MIAKYEEQFEEEIRLFPFEVICGAEKYWKKYFMEVYEIKNKTDLYKMIIEYKFKKCDVRWEELISVFESPV